MALNKKISLLAFDRQVSGKGTLAATKKFGFGVKSGSVLQLDVDDTYEELTINSRFPPSAYRTGFTAGFSVLTRLWPKTAGLLYFAALGTDVVTGAVDPFTHTITPAATPLYLSAFAQVDTEYHAVRDVRIDELAISWDGANPLECNIIGIGTVWTGYTASFSPTNDDSLVQSFFPAGGTFELDTSTATPATADVVGGSITIRNHLSPIQLSKAIARDDNWPGWQEIECVVRLIPTDTTLWRKAVTGTAGGTAVANAPVYGSFHEKFIIQASPERSIDFTALRAPWRGSYVEPDAAGGPAVQELRATVVKATSGSEITVVVLNDQNSTAYAGS